MASPGVLATPLRFGRTARPDAWWTNRSSSSSRSRRYTLGCHSLRHLVGGRIDCLSASPRRETAYDFDRTADGRILQRNFGGHRYPRLAHVGDRTGLEMIRTLQDHGIHRGIDVHMECTILSLVVDDGRVVVSTCEQPGRQGWSPALRASASCM
jgi:hypothetical protein